jgi:hypothetical protein
MADFRADRRAFLRKGGAMAAGSMLAAGLAGHAAAAEHEHEKMETMMGHGGTDGYELDSSVTQRCGTCEFWGAPRRLSEDGKTVTITGLGWCNNPKSRNYQKMTSPEHGPMAVWRKWPLIP